MKSILMLTPFFSPNIGGVETHLDDLIGYLVKRNYLIWVITYQPLTTPGVRAPFVERGKNLRIYRLPWPRANLFYRLAKYPPVQFLYLFLGIFVFSFFFFLKNSAKIKIIHGHGLASAFAAVFLGQVFRKKTIVSLHTIYKFKTNPGLTRLVRPALLACDHILILAKAGKEDLVAVGIPEKKVDFYSNWVDLKNEFKPDETGETRRQLGFPFGKRVFLFVGRLSPEKGVNQVIKIIELLRERKDIYFVIIGGGPLKDKIEKLKDKYSHFVRFVGPVSPAILPRYYQAADFLIWASADQDYFGRVAMGAMACGLPVLVPTKTAYFDQWRPVKIDFPEGEVGFWIDPSPRRAAAKIEKIIEKLDRKKFELIRKKARKYALVQFSDKNAAIFLKVYEQQ